MTSNDNIIRPRHYTGRGIEPINVIHDWDLNFDLGNVVKYVARAGRKRNNTRLQDLQKARQYLDFEIERIQNEDHSHSAQQERSQRD